MADDKDEKAKLFRRISGANDLVVLQRMRLFGFWPAHVPLPPDPVEEVEERAKIQAEIAGFTAKGLTGGPEAAETALKEERLRRWEESKKRRAEKKKIRAAAIAERRAAWRVEKAGRIVHAGEGVSGGLEGTKSDADALMSRGLPVLHTGGQLAAALGITVGRLRFLTFHRNGTALVHYHRYGVPKRTGGIRSISAPKRDLKAAQHWILKHVVGVVGVSPEAHGFVTDRSIVTNASVHVGKKVVVNLDLRDFFPTLTFRRTKGLFVSLGYGEHVATLLALLTTEPPRVKATFDDAALYVALGERVLPQGAPTSPAITNLVCRSLDRRLRGLADKHGFAYTRYADDLTFSGNKDRAVGRLLKSVRAILIDEGFVEHPDKTKVMRRGRRQEVTGVVVNDRVGVARDQVRTLRAILHNAEKNGLDAQNRDGHPSFAAHLRGRIAFVSMVDPAKGLALAQKLDRVLAAAHVRG